MSQKLFHSFLRWVRMALIFAVLTVVHGLAPAQMEFGNEKSDFEVKLLGEDEDKMSRPGPLKVLGLDDRPKLRDHIENLAFDARARIRETTRVDWEGTAYIVWVDDEDTYRQMTNKSWEFTAAAANAAKATVWINARAWQQAQPGEHQKIMTHELGHLLVGDITLPKRIPLWAEEGLVMHLAGEWSMNMSMSVTQAHMAGQLPDLADLEMGFPSDPERQKLAYAVSYLAVRQIGDSLGDERGTATRMMRRLADDQAGPLFIEKLCDPVVRDGWQRMVGEGLGGRLLSFIIVASSGTTLWLVAAGLLFLAWRRKKKLNAIRRRREDEEEAWAESLTEKDIQDVWGDPDQAWRHDEEDHDEELYPWEKWERMRQEEEERY